MTDIRNIDLASSGAQLLQGPAGALEVLVDVPKQTACEGMAIVAHPHPKMGGDATHKLPQLIARALCDAGWLVARPNFRGAGRSAGPHDEGRGETDDLLMLADGLREAMPGQRLLLFGFSFGAFVQARVARALADRQQPAWRTCLAGMPYGEVAGGQHYEPPDGLPDALVLHGENDDRVPLSAVMDWARPTVQPVVVVPGADHFFAGKLHLLRALVLGHLRH